MVCALITSLVVSAAASSTIAPEIQAVRLGAVPNFNALTTTSLPSPPSKAVLVTQTYGTITLDHAAHLARKISCKTCHGPGVVTKFGRLPPPEAHGRCITCHTEQKRGPTKCRDCHVKAEPPPQLASAELKEAGAPAAPGAVPAAMAAPVIQNKPGTPVQWLEDDPAGRIPQSVRTVEVGYMAWQPRGGVAESGMSLALSIRRDGLLILYEIDQSLGSGSPHTAGFVGGGLYRNLYGAWGLVGAIVGGFSADSGASNVVPVAGLRLGAEYMWRRLSLGLAVTGASNLIRDASGRGPTDVAMTYSAFLGYLVSIN